MKKCFLRILLLIVFCGILLPMNSMADENENANINSLVVKFNEDSYSAKIGETFEAPLIITNIGVNDAEGGLTSVTCKIQYDDSIFELVTDSSYQSNLSFDKNSKIVTVNNVNSMMERKELTTFSFKVKDGAQTGDYYLTVTEVVGQNGDSEVYGTDFSTAVHVDGIGDNDEKEEYENAVEGTETVNVEVDEKEAILDIKQNEEGTLLTIVPDESNGEGIGRIVINGSIVARRDGKYTFETNPGETYTIYAYSKNGNFLLSKVITMNYKNEQTEPAGESDNTNDDKKENEDANVTENTENEANKADNNTVDNEVEPNETDANKSSYANGTRSPQTGDFMYVAIGIIAAIVCIWTLVYMVRVNKD